MGTLYLPNSRNILCNSPHYGEILKEYNTQFKENKGKINNKVFFETIIKQLVPTYGLMNWYQFLRRWKTAAGLEGVAKIPLLPSAVASDEQKILLSNEQATQSGIQHALNIGTMTLMEIAANPEALLKMSPKDRIDLLFKAMKAQDSRIHAVGRIKEDTRQQEKFDRAFQNANYDEE